MLRAMTKELGELTIKFRHEPHEQPEETTVFLQGNDGEEIFFGKAYKHPKDQFHKETGRFLALSRAVESLEVSDKTRRQIIASYFLRDTALEELRDLVDAAIKTRDARIAASKKQETVTA